MVPGATTKFPERRGDSAGDFVTTFHIANYARQNPLGRGLLKFCGVYYGLGTLEISPFVNRMSSRVGHWVTASE